MFEKCKAVMTFPTALTAEEKHLKELFEKLKTVRRAIAAARGSGGTSGGGDHPKAAERRTVKRSIEEATEEVKRKVMMGTITVNKVREKSTFKRSKTIDKRRDSSDIYKESSAVEPGEITGGPLLLSPPSQNSSTTSSFSTHQFGGDSPPTASSSTTRRAPLPPNRGPTLYVRGYDLMTDPLTKAFEKYGQITRLNIEDRQKSAFITFDSLEQADLALREMDGNMVNGITMRVSYARRQNQSNTATGQSNKFEWSSRPVMPLVVAPPLATPSTIQQPPAQTAWSEATQQKPVNSIATSGQRKRENNRNVVSYADDDPFL